MKNVQFQFEKHADDLRLYARYGAEIIGAIEGKYRLHRLDVDVIYVRPDWRGRGVANALMQYLAAQGIEATFPVGGSGGESWRIP